MKLQLECRLIFFINKGICFAKKFSAFKIWLLTYNLGVVMAKMKIVNNFNNFLLTNVYKNISNSWIKIYPLKKNAIAFY